MILFDLDAASLTAGPVTSWAGTGVTLTARTSVYPTAVTSNGHPAVRFPAAAGGEPAWVEGTGPLRDTNPCSALHVVMAWPTLPTGSMNIVTWGGLDVIAGTDGVGLTDVLVPAPVRPHVLTVVWDGEDARVALNGTVVGESIYSFTNESSDVRVLPWLSTGVVDIHRIQGSSGELMDVLDEASSLAAQYTVPPINVTGSGVWDVDGSGDVTLEDVWLPVDLPDLPKTGTAEWEPDPVPVPPPANVSAEPLRRMSEIMPSPTLDARGNPVAWQPSSVVRETVGRVQVIIGGQDVSYYGGVETPLPTWSRVEPFGAESATITLPQITAFHRPGTGDLAWLERGANVVLRRVNGGTVTRIWSGVITGFGSEESTGTFTVECIGVLFTADLQLRPPSFDTQPVDAGAMIADLLNSSVSRRYNRVTPVVTGCKTSVLGGWESRVTGWVQQALATMVTKGRQWTVACDDRTPVIRKKDTTTVSWTVSHGQRGVDVNLTQDLTQAVNVVYGEGINPKGGRWRNARYPNWRPDDTPEYPGPMATGMTVGYTDAQSTGGKGVSTWQEKAGQPVTGVLSNDDRVAWRQIQEDAGIRVDNYLGPQTWAATFAVGSNTGSLDGAFIAPLARVSKVEPNLYGPDGDVTGANPDYDPDVIRVERYISFGPGVEKSTARTAARELIAREANPGWVGTVTLSVDPEEGSRFDVIREGSNGEIRYFRGRTLLVHVARVEYGPDTVTMTVDTNARDYPTLDAILDREREAVDPARQYRKRPTAGTLATERATFDAESPGGRVPRHAAFAGLWNVLRIPVAAYGSIVRTVFTTSNPATPFALAVFDRPINAARLLELVGNPLVADENPWQVNADDLEAAGLLMSWGWAEQPGGYYPREKTNPDGETTAPVTGRLVDDASWTYASARPPWLWVAVICQSSTWVEGRFWHGVDV